ncbi:hypothetical protein IQ243_05930 [Nostocales cyanobacterium LEGE 11386]|nr:hypothetical protein [Nostocales cyanobacterium LEGE 11386]
MPNAQYPIPNTQCPILNHYFGHRVRYCVKISDRKARTVDLHFYSCDRTSPDLSVC